MSLVLVLAHMLSSPREGGRKGSKAHHCLLSPMHACITLTVPTSQEPSYTCPTSQGHASETAPAYWASLWHLSYQRPHGACFLPKPWYTWKQGPLVESCAGEKEGRNPHLLHFFSYCNLSGFVKLDFLFNIFLSIPRNTESTV